MPGKKGLATSNILPVNRVKWPEIHSPQKLCEMTKFLSYDDDFS